MAEVLPTDLLLTVIQAQSDVARLGPDLPAVMALVTERAQQLTAADGAVIELAEGDEMVYRAASGCGTSQLGLRLARQGSLSGLSVNTNQVLICLDSEEDPRVDRAACRRVGIRSMVVVPLHHNGTVVGVLKVAARQPDAFSSRDGLLLGMLTDLIGSAMFHAGRFANDDLLYRATHDALTGLANRALFYDRLHQGLHQAQRSQQNVGIAMIDVDGLKAINDQFGHQAGDQALRQFALRLQHGSRQADTVARLGGDEFALLLQHVQPALAEDIARRLVGHAECSLPLAGQQIPLQASVGLALYPDDGSSAEQLLAVADQRMYNDKRQRKLATPMQRRN